jgi:glycosyltransferase involved in cell wall biosynthesis
MRGNISTAIIIPIYATSIATVGYLDLCLTSCKDQEADEILVWDDGSTESIEDIKKKHANVKFFEGKHIGKSYARNSLVRLCSTTHIYPVDADDEVMPGALTTLLDAYNGVPLYSDIIKRSEKGDKVHILMPFDCENAKTKCLSSVNVLHSVKQWKEVGGWDEILNLYEDWEYNSKLFLTYCGRKLSVPLIIYRQHDEMSVKRASKVEDFRAASIVKDLLKDYDLNLKLRRDIMGCCGKRRDSAANTVNNPGQQQAMMQSQKAGSPVVGVTHDSVKVQTLDMSTEADLVALGDPGPGKVWAKYNMGRGMGPHDKRGMSGRMKYKQVVYGGIYAVMSADAITKSEFESGRPSCGFIAMENIGLQISRPEPPVPTTIKAATIPVRPIERTPITAVDKEPVKDSDLEKVMETLSTMSVKEIRDWLTSNDASTDNIASMIDAEKRSGNRIGAMKILEKALNEKMHS